MDQTMQEMIRFENIGKVFGSVVANKDINLSVYRGEILSLLGENGSGKTTLMNMLSGIYYPDCGTIYVDGKPAVIRSPKDAYNYKIGMVHQHFKLIDVFTALENIVLGIKPEQNFFSSKEYSQRKIRDSLTRLLRNMLGRQLKKFVKNMDLSLT